MQLPSVAIDLNVLSFQKGPVWPPLHVSYEDGVQERVTAGEGGQLTAQHCISEWLGFLLTLMC